jgi:hypothetical protein
MQYILIRLNKPVSICDDAGNIMITYPDGQLLYATADRGDHWVTAMGGIWKTEAELAEC